MRKLRIAIIGGGAGGIMSVIKLREAGIDDVTVFEKAGDIGGTWRDNSYPGLTCDVPSHLYRYSFEPNPDWTHVCSPGPEILAYLKRVAEKYDVMKDVRLDSEVTKAEFKNDQWHLETVKGPEGAFDAVLVAVGVLHHPVYPKIDGLDSFDGPSFHTARWDHSVSLEGKRVGIIGTGSTAVQIVGAVIDDVEKLSLFQRTAQWVLPLPNPEIAADQKDAYRSDPALMQAEYERLAKEFNGNFAAAVVGANTEAYAGMVQACEENLATVKDPDLRAKLTPNYKVGCKRLVMSHNFYDAIQKPNADVVTDPIAHIEANGVRTKDGTLHELDVLVLATGFDTHRFVRPMNVTGTDGLKLDDAWANANEGYMAVTVPGFPNWFMIGGPNSPIGNFSWILTAENQFNYALKLIEQLRDGNARSIAPKREAASAFNAAVRAKMPDTIWASGCGSWYIDKNGNVASWPWTYERFEELMREPILDDFEIA